MSVTVTAEKRTLSTKGTLKSYRRAGRIPAVLYGKGIEPERLLVGEKDVKKLLEHPGLFDLSVDGRKIRAMVRDIQKHPIQQKILHVDFMKVDMDRPVEADVPLRLIGEPLGVKQGGVLEQVIRTVKIRALPAVLPEHVDLDVSSMQTGDSLTLESLVLPDGVELLSDRDVVAVSVVPPQAGASEAAPEESGEPEADS